MNIMTLILFAIAGGLTFIAGRVINATGAGGDVVQLVYPLVAMFSLWLSSCAEKWEKRKAVKNSVKAERDKWHGIVRELRLSKSELAGKIILTYRDERSYTEGFLSKEIKSAIKDEFPYKVELNQLQSRMAAITSRNKELIKEAESKDEHIDAILTSKSSLDRKISEFIRQLRVFHQEINKELKVNDYKSSGIWRSIDELADKIFEEINLFDAYISQSLIEDKEKVSPFNRKLSQQTSSGEFVSHIETQEADSTGNKKK